MLKAMFQEMTVNKSTAAISKYYHPDFLMFTNGKQIGYAENLRIHEDIYKTPIQYKVEYDPTTVVENDDRVAARVYITTQLPNEKPKQIEVILIAQYRGDKIYRLWELTFPDWSKMPTLDKALGR